MAISIAQLGPVHSSSRHCAAQPTEATKSPERHRRCRNISIAPLSLLLFLSWAFLKFNPDYQVVEANPGYQVFEVNPGYQVVEINPGYQDPVYVDPSGLLRRVELVW